MAAKARTGWRGWLARLKPRDRWELTLLVTSIIFLAILLTFTKLASEVLEGETLKYDRAILLSLRTSGRTLVSALRVLTEQGVDLLSVRPATC